MDARSFERGDQLGAGGAKGADVASGLTRESRVRLSRRGVSPSPTTPSPVSVVLVETPATRISSLRIAARGSWRTLAAIPVPSQAAGILPTQAQRRVGGGTVGHKTTPHRGVARARVSARFKLSANRAERRFACGRQEGLEIEPVLTFNLAASPQGAPDWCSSN